VSLALKTKDRRISLTSQNIAEEKRVGEIERTGAGRNSMFIRLSSGIALT
jgi:hypothetical protein